MLPLIQKWREEVNRRYLCDLWVKFRCLVEGKRQFLDNSYEMAFWLELRNPLPSDLLEFMGDYCDVIYEEVPFLTYLDRYGMDGSLSWENVRCYGKFPEYENLIEEEESWEVYYTEEDNPILTMFQEYPEFNLADALTEFRSSMEEELVEIDD